MFSLISVSPTYQTIENPPMRIVEMCGVRKRGWMAPRLAGIAPARALESEGGAVGRVVVCGAPAAGGARRDRVRAGEGDGRRGDDHVDADEDEGAGDGRPPRRRPGVRGLLV